MGKWVYKMVNFSGENMQVEEGPSLPHPREV